MGQPKSLEIGHNRPRNRIPWPPLQNLTGPDLHFQDVWWWGKELPHEREFARTQHVVKCNLGIESTLKPFQEKYSIPKAIQGRLPILKRRIPPQVHSQVFHKRVEL